MPADRPQGPNSTPQASGFIRDAWYVAGFSHEFASTPCRRVILEQPVALYRDETNQVIAIGDVCPHRYASLSDGQRMPDGVLRCPYHGLSFDKTGACVGNPHGDGHIPGNARVPSYPVLERQGLVWIWMGLDGDVPPAHEPAEFELLDRPGYAAVSGQMVIKANYQLIIDNLLDLSHVEFLHPALRAPDAHANRHEVVREGRSIVSLLFRDGVRPSGLQSMFWGSEAKGNAWAHMRWTYPSILELDTGISVEGNAGPPTVHLPALHLLTPESPCVTHYRWISLRNCRTDDAELGEKVRQLIDKAFSGEDKPMIERQQLNLGTNSDLLARQPVHLKPDGASIQVRRKIREILALQGSTD